MRATISAERRLSLLLVCLAHFALASCVASKSGSPDAARREVLPEPQRDPAPPADGKLRIIAFGAHPDDCEIKAGGTAALWAEQGHHVLFVSVTNGDIGHWKMAGGPLAERRRREVEEAAELLGVTTRVLDIHDGELEPTLENRRKLTRLIREWRADIVLGPRPNDYHPDHRYTGVLVQDAAYMVTVPFFCPDVPHLEKNPVFIYYEDRFQKPNPFVPEIVVGIDAVSARKLEALGRMESQFLEGGANGHAGLVPDEEGARERRAREVDAGFSRRFANTANQHREVLQRLYGEEAGRKIQHAEAFELCEYGRQPSLEELRGMFPLPPARE